MVTSNFLQADFWPDSLRSLYRQQADGLVLRSDISERRVVERQRVDWYYKPYNAIEQLQQEP